jgi:CheY-like chemotaxis protein
MLSAITYKGPQVIDHSVEQPVFVMMFKHIGNATRNAYDSEEVIVAAADFQPDVILLDIGLPKLNGYEACRRIRELSRGKEILIIVQTGWDKKKTASAPAKPASIITWSNRWTSRH